MNCPECGHESKKDSRFCTNCGTPMESASDPPPDSSGTGAKAATDPTEKSVSAKAGFRGHLIRNVLLLAGAIVVVAAVASGATYAAMSADGPPEIEPRTLAVSTSASSTTGSPTTVSVANITSAPPSSISSTTTAMSTTMTLPTTTIVSQTTSSTKPATSTTRTTFVALSPDPPTLVSPEDGSEFFIYFDLGAESAKASVKLDWGSVSGATSYRVEVESVETGYGLSKIVTSSNYSFSYTLALADGPQTMRWRVTARSAEGDYGPSSAWRSFRFVIVVSDPTTT